MNWFRRIGLALRLAPLVFDEPKGEKTVANMVETWREGKPSYPEVNFESMVKSGFRRNELIYSCISKTAKTASQVELRVRQKGSDEVRDDHPLKALIDSPNPYMSEYDLWSSVIIFRFLAGRAVFEKVRSSAGVPVQLWPLRPDWLTPIPSSKAMIGGYEYSPPGLNSVTLAPEDVLDFKMFDPLNKYQGWPPVAVCARVGDVDNSATDFIKLFLDKGGVPPGVLKTKQRLNDAIIQNLRRRWREKYGGFEHWMEPAILEADAEYQKIGFTFEELGFETLDARSEARICSALDVPPILVGARVGLARATYSNYREARLAWWQDTLVPGYKDLNDTLKNQLLPEFGPRNQWETFWDFSQVPALQEERDARWRISIAGLMSGGITVNEFRQVIGFSNLGPAGDVFLRPLNLQAVKSMDHLQGGYFTRETLELIFPGNGKASTPDKVWESQIGPQDHLAKLLEDYFEGQQARVLERVP